MGAAIPVIEALGATYAVAKGVTAGHGGMLAGAVGNSPAPGAPKQPLMPDQQQILQASQVTAAQQASMRYGRAATVLTGTGPGAQGATGELLGP